MNKNILLVDDEYDVISAYKRNLRRYFNIFTATSGKEAIEILSNSEEIAVVVTDFRMPQMDGIELLTAVQKSFPDTIRIIITGYADLQVAITAVNRGNIFRFLTKPMPTEDLITILNDSLEFFRLKKSEKELLNKTLKGVINILIGMQQHILPYTANQLGKIREFGRKIAEILSLNINWEYDIAFMLSKLGYIIVPQEILEKVENGIELDKAELKEFNSYPEYGASFIRKIPRLENIALAIEYQNVNYNGNNSPDIKIKEDNIPIIARILKVVNDFIHYSRNDVNIENAFTKMQNNSSLYDPLMMNALHLIVKGTKITNTVVSIKFRELRIGMVLARDLKDTKGNVLVKKGTEITDLTLMRLINATKVREIAEPLLVIEN